LFQKVSLSNWQKFLVDSYFDGEVSRQRLKAFLASFEGQLRTSSGGGAKVVRLAF